ncbi:MAG: glycosyltransferase [Planctomycetes bacterium]|nr:glycosyltransferase [Planctomycetota bacterium]
MIVPTSVTPAGTGTDAIELPDWKMPPTVAVAFTTMSPVVAGTLTIVNDPSESVVATTPPFAVSVAPLKIARGLQNKVLEAMAAGKPVVLSSGAAEGIAARDRTHFFVSDRSERVVGDVVSLLGDPSERARLGHAARRFVESHHRWDEVLREFELVVTGVTDPTEGSSQRVLNKLTDPVNTSCVGP